MKVLIATPCAHDTVSSHYAATMFYVSKNLARNGIEVDIQCLSLSDLELSRSILASQALADVTATHLLFVDSDMKFSSRLVGKMIAFDQDFVSAIYPKRTINMGAVISDSARLGGSLEKGKESELIAANLDYIGSLVTKVNLQQGKTELTTKGGFAVVKHTGMGVCLLKRRVLEQMVATGAVAGRAAGPHPASPFEVPYYGFFHKERSSGEDFYSEDISFCRRWTEGCGGTIWACIDEEIGHIGTYEFSGAYIDKLRLGRF
jgi:hypothetical protein